MSKEIRTEVQRITENELLQRVAVIRESETRISQLHREKADRLRGIFNLAQFGVTQDGGSRYRYRGSHRFTDREHLYLIRSLRQTDLNDLNAISVFLQEQWGAEHPEATDTELITILDLGGLVLGAYDQNGQIIGASQILPGYDSQTTTSLIADQTVVTHDHRDFGLGKVFKYVTFDKMIDRGITRLYMTFDPQRVNLWGLNVGRLGAKVIEFVENKYGGGLSGTFNAEDKPTDRVVGLYDLTDPVLITKVLNLPYERLLPDKGSLVKVSMSFDDTWQGIRNRALLLREMLEGHVVVDFTRDQELIFSRRDGYNTFYLRKAD